MTKRGNEEVKQSPRPIGRETNAGHYWSNYRDGLMAVTKRQDHPGVFVFLSQFL